MSFEQPDHLTVENARTSFSGVLAKEYIEPERLLELERSKIILLPLENYREHTPLCFHHGTRSLYLYFKEKHPELDLDLCINKNDFKELALHSDEFRLGTFILEAILAPTFVTLLTHYIINTLLAKKDDKVNVNLIVVDDRSKQEGITLSYRGSPVDMESKINTQIGLYTKAGKIISTSNTGNHIDEER